MTTKTECLTIAASYRAKASAEIDILARLTVAFGSKDPVTLQSQKMVEMHNEEAARWERLAAMHPKTRNAMIGKGVW